MIYGLRKPLARSGSCLCLTALFLIAGGCSSESANPAAAPISGVTAGSAAGVSATPAPGSGGTAAPPITQAGAPAAGMPAAGAPAAEDPPPPPPPADQPPPNAEPIAPTAETSKDSAGRIVAACHGLPLLGMKHSPGGTTLPNKCAPFHVRDNNPYAVRCIDAMPNFKTPFPGDEYCILPPPPEKGFQVGVHPGGNIEYWEKMWAGDYSFYEDPSITDEFVMHSGEDKLQNYLVAFEGPTDERYFYRRHFRSRYGSHHGNANFTGSPVTEGWQDNGERSFGSAFILVQNAYTDVPQSTQDISPEEKGVGMLLPVNSGLHMNLHHFNNTDAPLLRENWINAWYMPAEEVTRQVQMVLIAAAVNYPIGMQLDTNNSVVANAETQVLSLWGHRHAWTTRFHAWVERVDGSQELVYDSHDWYDMPTFSYNSVAKNPEPGKGFDGASSGPLVLQPGDRMHFNCHVDTTQARAVEVGVPLPTAPITWANDATSAEMCLLNGQTTGGTLFGGIEHINID